MRQPNQNTTDNSLYIEDDETLEMKSSKSTIKPTPTPEGISVTRETLFLLCMTLQQMLTQAGVGHTINPYTAIAETFGVQDMQGKNRDSLRLILLRLGRLY